MTLASSVGRRLYRIQSLLRNRVRASAQVQVHSASLRDSQSADDDDNAVNERAMLVLDSEERDCCSEQSEEDTECSISFGEGISQCRQKTTNTSRISEPTSRERKLRVSFGTVTVRDYGIIQGDHPCCSHGPPITIDWGYHQKEPLDVNVYEQLKNDLSCEGLTLLNCYQRKFLLGQTADQKLKGVLDLSFSEFESH